MKWKTICSIGIGGALGTLCRYVLNIWTTYPLGTLIENLLASFLLGGITGWFLIRKAPDWLKAGLGMGFLGSFSTMSTLAAETVFLLQYEVIFSLIYLVTSFFGGVGLALVGMMLGRWIGDTNPCS
ncbi:CrcB family protein [Salicibibacter cibarius]|uniref:Fluoride-specific ion channel FluC n=1 Tax=Salicibibacter cibarius TaxID=2743000 RepID=A0A7T6Z4Q9_9BACI|nr:CrcB family protein [Salicibibacter cibarius]QQK76963.1 CrcB family protein [Salicibibacter cibarius]